MVSITDERLRLFHGLVSTSRHDKMEKLLVMGKLGGGAYSKL